MPLDNQLRKPDLNKVIFWMFSSLAFLFFMGALFLTMVLCDEYVNNPNVCENISVLNSFTPYILMLLLGVAALSLVFWSLGYANTTFSERGKRITKKERNIERRGF